MAIIIKQKTCNLQTKLFLTLFPEPLKEFGMDLISNVFYLFNEINIHEISKDVLNETITYLR